jgi:SAM-dependent methyltransferase
VRKLAELEATHWWYRERRELLRQIVPSLLPHVEGAVAFDVGAAAGGNTGVLEGLGLLAVAVESDRTGAEIARDRRLSVVQADGRNLPFADGSADLVIAFDVLEHVEDDWRVVGEARRVLKRGGWLLVAVPADMSLWSAHDEEVGHVRRYDKPALLQLIGDGDLSVRWVRSWNVILRQVVAFRRRRAVGSDLTLLHPAINAILGVVIRAERRVTWLHDRPGVSLILGATKR